MLPQPENPVELSPPECEFSRQEGEILLQLARRAIRCYLRHEKLVLTVPSPHLALHRGAFTSLYLEGHLRGCVGIVQPQAPLYNTVAQTAVSAAFQDPRFDPVTAGEEPGLLIEVSVLSSLFPITPGEIRVGRHGLMVSMGGRRGLLLPQVAPAHGFDVQTFLEETCLKAGLAPNAWQMGALIEGFTAEIFREEQAPAGHSQRQAEAKGGA